MKLSHALAYSLLPAIVASLAIWLAVEHQARLKQAKENQILEQQLQPMAGLAARNEQLSNLLAQANAPEPLPPARLLELLHLRGEVGVLRRQQANLNQAHEENHHVHAVLERYLQTPAGTKAIATDAYWPQNAWSNSGYGSPEAALKTVLWAGANGDVTNFSESVSDEGRQSLGTQFEGKSETERSIRLADETYGLQSVQMLGREALDNQTVLLTVELETQDGFLTVKMVMKKTVGGWKFAGPQQ